MSEQIKPWRLMQPKADPPDLSGLCTEIIHRLMTLSEQIDLAYGFRSKVGFKAAHALGACEDLRRYLRSAPPDKHEGGDHA